MSAEAPRWELLPRAWYAADLVAFREADPSAILGELAAKAEFTITTEQTEAWRSEIEILRVALADITGTLLLEFTIPRMGHRADAVVLAGPAVFVIEFKSGASLLPADAAQVWDYALDLKYFHQASHNVPLIPLLVLQSAAESFQTPLQAGPDRVYQPICVSPVGLADAMHAALATVGGGPIDVDFWRAAPYRPTPTIIEAARALFARHSVAEIANSEAAGEDLRRTSARIDVLADKARAEGRKVICFVTGVPGAGKTLIGLDAATRRAAAGESHAVYLSGNGPLVEVLRAALLRDRKERDKAAGQSPRRGSQDIKSFIQNVHHFRDEGLKDPAPPSERLVIFDEAQRAWTQQKLADFLRRRKNIRDFRMSEPEFLIECMDRHQGWALIACLVGGGQEIHSGEAGIGNWLEAINRRFPHWDAYLSPHLTDHEYAADEAMAALRQRGNILYDAALHLAISVRQFRAENLSTFVKALLDCERERARVELARLRNRYPIVLTRDLALAKRWVRAQAEGSQRYGLLCTSRALRLKPHAIDVRVEINPVHWFLNGPEDVRSSYYLEDAATEFQVQGLELDWACVTWDGDLRFRKDRWTHHNFRGSRWENVNDIWNRIYVRNAYRVLLTRARRGMAIVIPPGEVSDPTRLPDYYDSTYEYMADLGLPLLH